MNNSALSRARAWTLAALLVPPVGFAARDPFSPPEQLFCEQAPSSPPQLRGIIGRDKDYRAWLIVDGSGRLWAAQSWPDKDWQLRDVSASGITLASAAPCRPPLRINLQGRSYETSLSVENAPAAMAGAAAAWRAGAALSVVR